MNCGSLHIESGGRVCEVQPGEVLVLPNSITYADTPDENVEALERQIRTGAPWRDAVHERFRGFSPWLDRCVTFAGRDLFFRGVPLALADRVLDVGSGWGQLAIPLAHRARVCSLEPRRSKIFFQQAVAEQEGVRGRLWFVNADYGMVTFRDRFNLAILNGVLEWVGQFTTGDPCDAQVGFLEKLCGDLEPGGRCVIGIENRLGLKYLLGAPDDHTGASLVSIYDRSLAAAKFQKQTGKELRIFTYTLAEYGRMLRDAGFGGVEFHAAFPDYKVPSVVFPVAEPELLNEFFLSGGYIREHSGRDGADLPFQEELLSLYRSLAELGVAQYFAPSYYIVARRVG